MNLKVNGFLRALNQELIDIPSRERKEIVGEIQEHLNELIQEKIDSGKPSDQAIQEAIESFGSAKKLGIELKEQSIPSSKNLNTMEYDTAFKGAFLFLGGAIIDGSWAFFEKEPDVLYLACMIFLAIGFNAYIFSVKDWTFQRIKWLKQFNKIIWVLPAISSFFFFFNKVFTTFTVTFLFAYLFVLGLQYFTFRNVIKKRSLELQYWN
ncbi:hypothetical protein CN692_06210 [Bacillus sp. AFS002410]|uniref:permease prefix domain 1-containing protein n=1 Tax=Bacillus sp. AFS002410 TaxID=2033481 RepID=UPI000BF17990|nr:permease prefix domain 1-containing protein [Bacillus sp. AFS002410]PEJ59070.1 hypothetical protein CN692_06210 [Bacillus sp. AFS002410]